MNRQISVNKRNVKLKVDPTVSDEDMIPYNRKQTFNNKGSTILALACETMAIKLDNAASATMDSLLSIKPTVVFKMAAECSSNVVSAQALATLPKPLTA
jgi:hypothetical protein